MDQILQFPSIACISYGGVEAAIFLSFKEIVVITLFFFYDSFFIYIPR